METKNNSNEKEVKEEKDINYLESEIKTWEPSQEVFKDDVGEHRTYYNDKGELRKLYLSDKNYRLEGEDFEDYKNRLKYNKIMLKDKLKGKFIWRSRNFESRNLLKEAAMKGIEGKELEQYMLLSGSCNRGTMVKEKLEVEKIKEELNKRP